MRLREGLLYEMLPDMRKQTIRQRTINSLIERFHIDTAHATRVKQQALHLFDLYAQSWHIDNANLRQLLASACKLHEVGLLLSFKYHQKHGAYIVQHADLPGFDQTERQLLVMLISLYKGDIKQDKLDCLAIVSTEDAAKLLAILRLAIILCRRRKDDVLPQYQTQVSKNEIKLCLPSHWLEQHPLISDELLQESEHLNQLGLSLIISC